MSQNGRSFESTPRFDTVDEAIRFYSKRRSRVDKETLVKEYEFLRGEVNGTLAAQLQILSFGTATLGLVTGRPSSVRTTPSGTTSSSSSCHCSRT